jgi:ABC-type multidrug transport system fused ATPase/permease subunit
MNAGFEEIEEAAKKAYLHDQIMDFPKNIIMMLRNFQEDSSRELPLQDYF